MKSAIRAGVIVLAMAVGLAWTSESFAAPPHFGPSHRGSHHGSYHGGHYGHGQHGYHGAPRSGFSLYLSIPSSRYSHTYYPGYFPGYYPVQVRPYCPHGYPYLY